MSGEILKKLLDKPIAYHRVFVGLGVGITGAVMLSQAMYWGRRSKDEWFWKGAAQWEDETGLTVREQEGARRALREIGVLQEQRKGIPARLYFRVDFDALAGLLLNGNETPRVRKTRKQDATKQRSQIRENRESGYAENAAQLAQTAQPDATKQRSQIRENRESITKKDYTETTTEITQRLLSRPASQPGEVVEVVAMELGGDEAPATAEPTEPEQPAAPKKARAAAKPLTIEEGALQAACRATWSAYRQAYEQRYGVTPVRNAPVNANVKALVKRLGHEEAPLVAAWYVSSVSEVYVLKDSHGVGALLAKAESYRTQWARGQAVTGTAAQAADKTSANFDAIEEAKRLMRARRAAQGEANAG